MLSPRMSECYNIDRTWAFSTARSCRTAFRGSSVVERAAVNRLVVGSNPTRGAINLRYEDCSSFQNHP